MKKEDGYILIVIVGILTVFSLMAITFATLSRLETKAARNYADSVKCEAVARAGLEHAIYEIRLDKFGTDTLAYNDNDNGNYGLDENFDASGTSWPGNAIFPFVTVGYDNDGDSIDDSQWVYIPGTDTATSAIRLPGNLRARYAVLITDDREARVNINVTGNKAGAGGVHASNEGWSTFEIDLADLIQREVGNGEAIANSIIDTRHGSDLNPGTPGDDDPGKIPDPQNDGIDNDGDWTIGNDSNGNGIPDSVETNVDEGDNSESIDEANEFNSISPIGDDVPFDILAEAEIMGPSTYTSKLEEIFTTGGISPEDQEDLKDYLTTYSADTILCPEYLLDGVGTSTTRLNINALIYNEGAYTNTVTYDSDKKVKMLRDVLEAGGITGASGTEGYVERHQLAVNIKDFIDFDGTSTTYLDVSSGDTYYGVERTPYINEVEGKPGNTSGGWGKYIELFNPYDTAIPNTGDWTIEFGATTITLTGLTIPALSYYVIADDATAYEVDFPHQGGTPANQYDASVNNLRTDGVEDITLKDPGGVKVQVTQCGSTTNAKSMQLNDPRPIPLTATSSDPWEWDDGNRTAGEENDPSLFSPNVGDDDWTNATYPSSFLIANRRFSNKGYLGYIHRGKEWSSFDVRDTIIYPDVLQYITITDPSMDGIDNDGDGDIDADDIDGKEHRIPGLINVNTASAEVLESLPGVDNALAIAIEGDAPFTSIGNLVKTVNQMTGTGTKWEEEEIFRSISNLITTRSNVFTVYVTAQVTDEGLNVFAEKRIMAIVDRSVDPIRVRYFRWITTP